MYQTRRIQTRILLIKEIPLMHQTQGMTLSMARDFLTDLLHGHPQIRQGNQGQEDPLTFHLRDRLEGIREGLLVDRHRHRHRLQLLRLLRLLRLLGTLHRVPRELLQSLSHQHQRTKRSPMSKRQRTSPKRKSGIVSGDKPSSISRKIDETSIMTKRSFDSC
jgi:hypothetical protein